MASQYDLPYTGQQVETLLAKISELESEMPSKTSDLTNDSGFITSSDVPTKTSDLNNDSGFITNAPVAAEAARAQAAEALLATISSLQAEISRATGVEGTLQNLIDGIAAKIPSAATDQNQLADKAFVNSSIATATAEFRGTYDSLAELQAVSADENDYGYVRTTDAAGNTIFKRYKYASGSWVFEYDLNNSSFTASQWAAINSAVTAELVAKLSALPDNATLTAALAAKQDVIEDLSSIRSKANSAYQKPSGGIPKTDLASGVQTSLNKADSAVQESAIADNLTTNDPTKPLSAKQGVVLAGQISQLGQEVNGLDYTTDDAEVHQVNISSTVETTSGTRLRLLFYVFPGAVVSASCPLGDGVAASVYSTRDYAVIASQETSYGLLQSLSGAYVRSLQNAVISVEGYLSISLKKSDGSSFTAQEKEQYLAQTIISITINDGLAQNVDELKTKVGEYYDKNNANIFRAATGSESLVDNPNGTRIRCIIQVRTGMTYSIYSTDDGGFAAGVWDTEAHASRAATDLGMLQGITTGYTHQKVTGQINVDGYLSISLTNGNTAISDSRKQEMIDSLFFYLGSGLEYKVNTPSIVIMDDVRDEFEQPLALYTTPPFMKGVNHRGYSVGAPENTLPAFVLSYRHGFRYVETDIAFTADGVPVLLHDSTIDRTSNGTGNINDLTYQQVLQYDFGSWFSPDYAGTKIPTLMEFLALCRNLGLHPWLEIKNSANYTTEQIHEIVDLVESYGMKGNVTYLSFNSSYLREVVSYDETASVLYVVFSITDAVITTANSLRTGKNEVSVGSNSYTGAEIEKCKSEHFPLGVWTIESAQTIASLDPYISSVTSNSQNAMLIKMTKELHP